MRLTIPCRALTCSHLQCFDATLYIQMNEKKPTWVCPVCDKKAPYEHLIIDGYVASKFFLVLVLSGFVIFQVRFSELHIFRMFMILQILFFKLHNITNLTWCPLIWKMHALLLVPPDFTISVPIVPSRFMLTPFPNVNPSIPKYADHIRGKNERIIKLELT